MRIATYNVQNLFALDSDSPKPANQMRPLARMIGQVDADILVLQEVGSQAVLDQLNQMLATPYSFCQMVVGNSNRSIHLGVLSRLPVNTLSHRDHLLLDEVGEPMQFYASESEAVAGQSQPLLFFRDVLQINAEIAGQKLALFCVHLKSRTNQSWQLHAADTLRAAECRALVDIVQQFQRQQTDAAAVLLGDFNDLLSSDALAALGQLDLLDPVGATLRLTGRNPATFWRKRRMRIDHILLCQHAAAWLQADTAQIHISQMARTASDHYPVSVVLNVSAAHPPS